MKSQMRRWLLGLAMFFVFAGVYTPRPAEAQRVVVVVHPRQRHYYHRNYRHYHHYRHYRR